MRLPVLNFFVFLLFFRNCCANGLEKNASEENLPDWFASSGSENDMWDKLINVSKNVKDATNEEELDHRLFVNEETDGFSNETLNDEAFVADVANFDSEDMWDSLIRSRKRQSDGQVYVGEISEPPKLESSSLVVEDTGSEPVRGSTLAFVFDSTGSMRDELNQVKVGASQILAALRDHPDIPIHNYVLVPFGDPVIGPVTVTSDHKIFRDRIEDISVSGGGDCPEMSVGAIKKALEVSLPNSYIYVFTDASAKDFRLQNEVLSLIQRKQAQVVFIMTDDCKDLNENSYQVYERIAETSSGQVYHLSKSEVKEVLKYVRVALQPHVVHLLSQHKPAPVNNVPDEHEVMVDDSLKQFTVSVSGKNASITVKDPKGKNIEGPPQLETLLKLKNVKVVNVKEPHPGPWKVMINSDSDYTVRSTGLSEVHFNHGFSTVETNTMIETNHRPLKGALCYILIQTSDFNKVHNLTTVDIVGLNGEVLRELPLEEVPGIPGVFKGGGFVPPSGYFYLGITGFGNDGHPIKRITTTAISPQLPERPFITTRTKTLGRVDNPGVLTCYVQSIVPFSVRWYKNGQPFGIEQNYSQTCEVQLEIPRLSIQSEGNYTCQAVNVAGTSYQTTFLSITGDAPVVKVNPRVVASVNETVRLDCPVQSALPYAVIWTQFTARNEHSGILHPVSKGQMADDHSLVIKSVNPDDEGWYVCTATNKGGSTQGRVYLLVTVPLSVSVNPDKVIYIEGDSIRISCSASGKPSPRLEWRKDQRKVVSDDFSILIEEANGNLNLVIDYLEKKSEGFYACHAINTEESVSAAAELIYTEKPTISAQENNMMVKVGSDAVLSCSATGYPKPSIKWLKGGIEIESDSRIQVDENGALKISMIRSSDAGEYTCVSENQLGVDKDYIGLFVGSPPAFLQKPRDKKIEIHHNGTIPCSAIGMPPAEIKWKRLGNGTLNPDRMFHLGSGALRVVNIHMEDEGYYVCTAENMFGTISAQVHISVSGIEKPTPDKNIVLTDITTISGDDMIIPCGVILGNPPGTVKWFKNGLELKETKRLSVDKEGNLIIREVTSADRGDYLCFVSNVLSNTSRPYQVIVSESPNIIRDSQPDLKARKGSEVVIPCPVQGYPKPTITWMKNGVPLPMSPTIFQDENGSLVIRNVTVESGGTYVCTAVNSIGSASKATSVHIQVPPVITEDARDTSLNVVEGHAVVLNCDVVAVPTPVITWLKNNISLLEGEEKIYSQPEILRFVATLEDTGIYSCIAVNEVGSARKEFNVTILVPPNMPDQNQEESIKARAGFPITLYCSVNGFPKPTILWQRNGMYLTQNTSEVTIYDNGILQIKNVTKESSGAYVCDAENIAGITQRIYYLQVNFPPRIIEEVNITLPIRLKEGDEFSLPCLVEGNPKPIVLWKKNNLPVLNQQSDVIILGDNTLVFLQVTRDTTGIYVCEATNAEGKVEQGYEINVVSPPAMLPDVYPTRLEVNEGDSIVLTCPTSVSVPYPNIQWIKDGNPLNALLQERSDEAQLKLSDDQRSLTIVEAHPIDNGNYSCVATNIAGRTDARFVVDVLMTPHFEEFNHVAHRTILVGGEVILNCSVSGNPQPKVTWRKENKPINPQNSPGVHVSLDRQHLLISNGRIHHSGTYICSATNKVNTKEREFYVSVLEPPRIEGPFSDDIEVVAGGNVSLYCPVSGVPPPDIIWMKVDKTKIVLEGSSEYFTISKADCSNEGIYSCEATNSAGTRTKYFNLTILEPPIIEEHDVTEQYEVAVGGNLTLRCKTKGQPRPDITWLHNGHILNENRIRRKRQVEYLGEEISEEGFALLKLANATESDRGTYTVLASNKAGVIEKNFEVKVLAPPTLNGQAELVSLVVIHPLPTILKCPVHGNPVPQFSWYHNSKLLQPDRDIFETDGKELRIRKSNASHSGNYSCVAVNSVGNVTQNFSVTVIEPPKVIPSLNQFLYKAVNESIVLNCSAEDVGDPDLKFLWFRSSMLLTNTSRMFISNDGQNLAIFPLALKDSGTYNCLVKNKAGSDEVSFNLLVNEPPALSDQSPTTVPHKKVILHRPFFLDCPFNGHPPPKISWFKDGELLNETDAKGNIHVEDNFLSVDNADPRSSGDYRCIAENPLGVQQLSFKVDVIVIGEWTAWSDWSDCNVSCGSGEQYRERICSFGLQVLDPGLKVDKSKCSGEDIQKRKCHIECPISGGWSDWTNWTSCSTTCGAGTRRRYRSCDNPEPKNGGKPCSGEDNEEELCNEQPCPIDGQWSDWSSWSECSEPCGGGVKERTRKCDSPEPQFGGQDCNGWKEDYVVCNRHKCPASGKWMQWGEWSPCSVTCGKGHRKRHRKCKASKRGKVCKGENLQIQKCHLRNCHESSFPSSASLRVTGSLNGQNIDNTIQAYIESYDNERTVSANMSDILMQRNRWFPYAPFLLSPLSWNTAYETDDADNGYSLTNGNFFSQSDVQFATGEGMIIKHKGEGLDDDGSLIVEIEVAGEVPLVEPRASVIINGIDQDFVQTGSNSLYSSVQNDVNIEGQNLPFSWNSSIYYDNEHRTMPYLVEKLSMKDIYNTYNPDTQNLTYLASSTIGRKYKENRCPVGFAYEPEFMHCQDINECEEFDGLCGKDQHCENTFGSFECICRRGFVWHGNNCIDIDECSNQAHDCSHFCHNTYGSYSCSCPPGFNLNNDLKRCIKNTHIGYYDDSETQPTKGRNESWTFERFSRKSNDFDNWQNAETGQSRPCPSGFVVEKYECKDYNECEDPEICSEDETCLNTKGSHQCLSTPCPSGFERMDASSCMKYCNHDLRKCEKGTSVSEAVNYHVVTLDSPIPLNSILHLDVAGDPTRNLSRTRFKILESGELFRVRVKHGIGSLYSLRQLKPDTLYRVHVEAMSYDLNNVLLYMTDFIIFIIVPAPD